MGIDAARALQCETDFLTGVEANLEAAKGTQLRGSIWRLSRDDDSDRLRALLASNRVFDRERLKSLPANRRIVLRGFERRVLFGKRPTGVAVASVLSPLGHFASGDQDAPPTGLGELVDHVRRLAGDARIPHVIGVCSPTGFTPEARQVRLDMPMVTVVLIEPDGHGGWQVTAAGEEPDPRLVKIFDPERAKDKVQRVRRILDERRVDLLTGGLSASSVARQTGLSEEVVREGFRAAAAVDLELRVAEKDNEFILFRGATSTPAAPRSGKKSMNVIERIRNLFSREGDEVEKVNVLAERRASLAQRRDRIYEDIGKLEAKEAELFEQGKTATSQVPRRRIAAQLAHLRKDIARLNTTAAMLNKQIEIISTDIHNLTLIRQGQIAELPDSSELTEHAVKAEEMLETLKSDADLVAGLETGIEDTLTSTDELAILKEFEEAAKPAAEPPQRAPSAAVREDRVADRPAPQKSEPVREPESPHQKEDARRRGEAEPT